MNVFRLEFRSGRKGILIWALIMAAVIGIFMCVFPSMSGEAMGEVMELSLIHILKRRVSSARNRNTTKYPMKVRCV